LSIEQLLDQLKSETSGSAAPADRNKQTLFISLRLHRVCNYRRAAGRDRASPRDLDWFAMGLIVAVSYFLFVIIGDTLRGNPRVHPELLVWFPNVLFIVLGAFLFRRLARQ